MWQSNWHPSPRYLNHVLAGTWSVKAGNDTGLAARVLPDGTSSLVFQRAGTSLFSGENRDLEWANLAVAGPRSCPLEIELAKSGQIFIAQLKPLGAMLALGIPVSNLANRYETLNAILDIGTTRIAEAVLGDESDQACIQEIENWIWNRVQRSAPDRLLFEAVKEFKNHDGCVEVQDVAKRLHTSRRSLNRVLGAKLGMSPKLFARLLRFDNAVQMSRRQANLSWAEIALATGFADQPHLNREFLSLGGIRPNELRTSGAEKIW